MPSSVGSRDFVANLKGKQAKLEELAPVLVNKLADALVDQLINNIPSYGPGRTGTMLAALRKRTEPYQDGQQWVVGVGDLSLLGSKKESAPKHTIEDFLDWYEENISKKARERTRARKEEKYQRLAEQRERGRTARAMAEAKRVASLRNLYQRIRKLSASIDALYERRVEITDLILRMSLRPVEIRKGKHAYYRPRRLSKYYGWLSAADAKIAAKEKLLSRLKHRYMSSYRYRRRSLNYWRRLRR